MTNKGRIYRVLDPSRRDDPQVREVKTLLAQGMDEPVERCAGRAAGPRGHAGSPGGAVRAGRPGRGRMEDARPGRRVQARKRCRESTRSGAWNRPAGPHARRPSLPVMWSVLEPLLADPDPEVRAQAAKVVGERQGTEGLRAADRLLDDASPRVRFFAAIALGKLGRAEAAGPFLRMLRGNADNDPTCATPLSWGWSDPASPTPGVEGSARRFAGGADGGPAGDAAPRRSGDRRVLERSRSAARARGRAGDQRRADHRGTLPSLAALRSHFERARAAAAAGAQRQFPARPGRARRRLAEAAARVGSARAVPRAGPGDAGRVGQAVGSRQGDGALAADSRPVSAGRRADALRPKLAALLASAPRPVRTAAVVATAALCIKEAGAATGERSPPIATSPTRPGPRPSKPSINWPIPGASRPPSEPCSCPDRSRTEALRVLAKVDPAAAIAPFATASHTARPPNSKEPSPCSRPCPATPPATNFRSGSTG